MSIGYHRLMRENSEAKDPVDVADSPFKIMANEIKSVFISENSAGQGLERPVEAASPLVAEIEGNAHEVSRHFLRELPKHCSMLSVAAYDSCAALSRLIARSRSVLPSL